MLLSIVTLSLGIALHTSAPPFAIHPTVARPARQLLLSLDASELKIREAAIRVVAAANKFGDAQGEAAAQWVMDAMSSRGESEVDCAGLLGKQMALFDECLVEESGKCQELDQALTSLEMQLQEGDSGPVDALVGLFGQSKLDRASARVRALSQGHPGWYPAFPAAPACKPISSQHLYFPVPLRHAPGVPVAAITPRNTP